MFVHGGKRKTKKGCALNSYGNYNKASLGHQSIYFYLYVSI